MRRVTFKNPPKDLFFTLKGFGLTNFYEKLDVKSASLKGIKMVAVETKYSKNAVWGNIEEYSKLSTNEYNEKYYDQKNHAWKCASIDLTDEGIKILKKSNIQNYEIE